MLGRQWNRAPRATETNEELPAGVRSWTEEHVARWLATLSGKLGQLGPAFIENGIDGETLLILDDETVNALIPGDGGAVKLTRNKLKKEIAKLKNPNQAGDQNGNGPVPGDVVLINVKLPNTTVVPNMVGAGDRLTRKSTIRMVKQAIASKPVWNWDASRAKLQYNGNDLDLNRTLEQSGIPARGAEISIELVKSLPTDNPLVIISYGVDLISKEQGQQAQMPCGHTIGCQSLTQYVRSLTQKIGATKVTCPGFTQPNAPCNNVWDWALCRAVGQFTLDECKEFEVKFERNAMRALFGETKECPGCRCTLTKAEGVRSNRMSCPNCVRIARQSGGSAPDFCWICLRPWVGSGPKCGNDCNPIRQLNETLQSCPTKNIDDGANINGVPEIRACPSCRTLIYHIDQCKHMKCKACKKQFCFVCLKMRENGRWQCGDYTVNCEVHARQQFEEPA